MKKEFYLIFLLAVQLPGCIVIGGNWGGKTSFGILFLPLLLLVIFLLFRSFRRP